MMELWECCLSAADLEGKVVSPDRREGDSKSPGFVLGHWLNVNQCSLRGARKADFLLGHHVEVNEGKRSKLFLVAVDDIGDSGLRLHFSQGSSGWGLGGGYLLGEGWCCTGARKAARSLSLEVFSTRLNKAMSNLTQWWLSEQEPGLENHRGPCQPALL